MKKNKKTKIDISRIEVGECEDEDKDLIDDLKTVLSYVKKYFGFKMVKGLCTPSVIKLYFDDFRIIGEYNCNGDTFDSLLIFQDQQFPFNFHPFGGLGGLDTETLDKELSQIKKSLDR